MTGHRPSCAVSASTDARISERKTLEQWVSFAQFSEYSPLNLRDLPQPIPSDMPEYAPNNKPFTFEDAFEDLLTVAGGRPLVDIHSRLATRNLLATMFPFGEPVLFWVQRLRSRGLLGLRSQTNTFPGNLDSNFFVFNSRLKGGVQEVRDGDHRVRALRANDEERKTAWLGDKPADGPLFDRLDSIFKTVRSAFDGQAIRPRESRPSSSTGTQPGHDPTTEEAVMSAVRSGFEQSEESLRTFLKMMLDPRAPSNFKPRPGDIKAGLKALETKEEYVDERGNVHTTIRIRKVDVDGNEVFRETIRTERSSQMVGEII